MGRCDGSKPNCGRRANCARRSSRCILPRPPLRNSTKEIGGSESGLLAACKKPQPAIRCRGPAPATRFDQSEALSDVAAPKRALSRFLRSQPRRIGLGCPRQARPRRSRNQLNMGGFSARSKPELSTLLESGTFYFALTGRAVPRLERGRLLGPFSYSPDRMEPILELLLPATPKQCAPGLALRDVVTVTTGTISRPLGSTVWIRWVGPPPRSRMRAWSRQFKKGVRAGLALEKNMYERVA
jgi:hypothetical protein